MGHYDGSYPRTLDHGGEEISKAVRKYAATRATDEHTSGKANDTLARKKMTQETDKWVARQGPLRMIENVCCHGAIIACIVCVSPVFDKEYYVHLLHRFPLYHGSFCGLIFSLRFTMIN